MSRRFALEECMRETNKNTTAEPKNDDYDYIKIGDKTYCVKVHFGQIPLEEILRGRFLSGRDKLSKNTAE